MTIGRGGSGGRSHSPDKGVDLDPVANVKNVQLAPAILLAVAGDG